MRLVQWGKAWLKRADRAMLDLVYPDGAVCLNCGRLSGGEALCPVCREELERGWLEDETGPLPACWTYNGPAGQLVRRLKDNGVAPAADVLAEGICRRLGTELPQDTVVTWVPMPRRRLLDRGRDHGRTLAEAVARRLNLPAQALLRRRRGASGHTQRGLGGEQRRRNVQNAFEPAQAGEMPGSVLLVDDVRTTGATLLSCGKALRSAGVREVRMVAATSAGRARRRGPEEDGEP